MKSATELILEAAAASLAGGTAAEGRIFRDRADDIPADDELPCINVVRGEVGSSIFGQGATRNSCNFKLQICVKGANREVALDALHTSAHGLLLSDPTLLSLTRSLFCAGTDEPEHFSGDPTVARMTATYQFQTLTRAANLASAP
ncbi:MAG TPA: hypothetical protein VLC92_01170 [Rhodocyclaceae bacterium]|nr:hypothetical protein [Rhodocyclaceae bacterium]